MQIHKKHEKQLHTQTISGKHEHFQAPLSPEYYIHDTLTLHSDIPSTLLRERCQ